MTTDTDNVTLEDPRTQYATPEFKEQKQSLPGSEDELSPKADHGEKSYKGFGRLKGLNALITGGDSGIGRAIAIAYAREGANVAITYLNEHEDAQTTKKLIEDAGVKALAFSADQRESQNCRDAVDKVVKEFGSLNILVNNAAWQKTYEKITDIPDDELRRTFQTNIEGFFYFCRAAIEVMHPGDSIINTSSVQGYGPSAMLSPYAATKGAITNFTKSFSKEAMEKGVRVNSVAPGPVWTPLIPATMPKEDIPEFGSSTLFKRPAQPAELAPVYVFLASGDASYITGEVYGVTGGMMQV